MYMEYTANACFCLLDVIGNKEKLAKPTASRKAGRKDEVVGKGDTMRSLVLARAKAKNLYVHTYLLFIVNSTGKVTTTKTG